MTRPLEPFEQHEAILRERGICLWCQQSSCAVYAHDDYDAHECCWRSGASRRPWWSLAEFAALVLRNEEIFRVTAWRGALLCEGEASAARFVDAIVDARADDVVGLGDDVIATPRRMALLEVRVIAEQRRRAEASAKECAEALDELRRRMGGGRP